MPSPFPGMNPYIGCPDVWNDFHDTFIPLVREVLAPQVRPRYYIRIEEHLYIHEPSAGERFPLGRPDLSLHAAPQAVPAAGGTAVAAPASVGMPAEVEVERFPYLEIRDRADGPAVTIIELLSPVNKAASGRDQYRAKVRRVLASTTNFVEIDLLRAHEKMPWKELPACDYYAIVSRHADRQGDDPRAGLWPVKLREHLPTVPIPLRPGEPEPLLDIQSLLHRIYDTADYHLFLYEFDPEPRLSASDAVWAAQLLHPETPPA